jgi:hypothetical protein
MAAHGVRLELVDLPPIPMFGRPIALRSRAHAAEYRRCGAPTTPRGGARFGRMGRPMPCVAGRRVTRAAPCHIPARSRVEQTKEQAIKRQPRERNGLAGGRERCPAARRAAWAASRGAAGCWRGFRSATSCTRCTARATTGRSRSARSRPCQCRRADRGAQQTTAGAAARAG